MITLGIRKKLADQTFVVETAQEIIYIPQELTEDQKIVARENIGAVSGEGLATESYVDAKIAAIPAIPTNVSAFANDAGYITKHQSLEGYATETYVDTKIQTYINESILAGEW